MESIISVLTETTGAWESTLLQWCEENKDIWNIAGKYGSAAKETFVGLLCERLMALPAEETTPLLLALRLCLRDPAGLGPVLRNPALTTKVATIAGICGCSGKPNADALRVVVNLISKSPQAKATLVEACKACEGVTRLISVTDPADRDSLFLLYRIAVNLSIANEKVAAALRKDDALYRSVERDVVPLIPLVAAGDPRLFAPPMATEALKLLFSLTMHAGPLASAAATTPLSEHEKRGLAVLFPFFDVVLSLRDRAAAAGVCPGWYELKVAVIDCLLNLPKEELPTLVPKEVLMKTVDNLLFCASEAVDDEHKIHAELLVPVLMLLMGVMIYTPGSTAYIFEKCFPAEEFGSVDPHSSEGSPLIRTSKALGAKLARAMTTTNTGLKYIDQEFMFQVCSCKPQKLVSLTGIGLAAGLLQSKNFLQQFTTRQCKSEEPESETVVSEAEGTATASTPK